MFQLFESHHPIPSGLVRGNGTQRSPEYLVMPGKYLASRRNSPYKPEDYLVVPREYPPATGGMAPTDPKNIRPYRRNILHRLAEYLVLPAE